MNYKLLAFIIGFEVFVVSVVNATDGHASLLVNWNPGEYTGSPLDLGGRNAMRAAETKQRDSKQARFQIFRYQLLPASLDIKPDLFKKIKTRDDLEQRKNELFRECLVSIKRFSYSRTELIHRVLLDRGDYFVIRLGANRGISRTTREFTDEELENFPSLLLLFNNNPEKQLLAIEIKQAVFRHAITVANLLAKNLEPRLRDVQLHVSIMPTFEEREFWGIVEQFQKRLVQVEFRMVSPNLTRISKSLNLDLKALNQLTNTHRTTLKLSSEGNSTLTIPRGDSFIDSLVNYASKGGGNASFKVKGLKKRIDTKDRVAEASVDDLEITNAKPDDIAKICDALFNKVNLDV